MTDNISMDDENFMEKLENSDAPVRKAILQYLVRAGSFTADASTRILNEDSGDQDAEFPPPNCLTWDELRAICEDNLRGCENQIISRELVWLKNRRRRDTFTVMTWNILSQALADGRDIFPACPKEFLEWSTRRWKILQEITIRQPDILCLQEVDHFKFFERALATVGLEGKFFPKPDSPCLYVEGNNGPDGCAIFINTRLFDIVKTETRVLEVCTFPTNQVALFCKIRRRSDGHEMWVVSTHLKAMKGPICKGFRREQTTDLTNFLRYSLGDLEPVILCGDLNAKPNEEVHEILVGNNYKGAYPNMTPIAYTTWTVRDTEEYARILDYIYYRRGFFACESVLRPPGVKDIGDDRVPSAMYPSDHFSLVANLITQ